MIEFTVPGEPVGKGRPRFSSRKDKKTGQTFTHTYTPEKTASYENLVAWAGQQAMKGQVLMTGPVAVHMMMWSSVPKSKPEKWKVRARAGIERPVTKPDCDNTIKGVMDALNKIVWVDDSQVVELHTFKFYADTPKLVVRIWPWIVDAAAVLG